MQKLEIGTVYRLGPKCFGSYCHKESYDRDFHIFVRILSKDDRFPTYRCTTQGVNPRLNTGTNEGMGDREFSVRLEDVEEIPERLIFPSGVLCSAH